MGPLFYLVLNMSITASAIGLVVAGLRRLLRGRLPALAQYALWALVCLRLLLPFSLPSDASVLNPIGEYLTRIVIFPVSDSELTVTNFAGAVNSYFPQPMRFKTHALAAAFDALGAVWLAGVIIVAAAATALYLLTALRLRRAVPVNDHGLLDECRAQLKLRRKTALFASDAVTSPVVFGIFRPRIIIPPALICDRETLRFVLLHELVHIRRLDTLRVVLFLVVCVHWFNPLIWLFYHLAGRDMELACDAGAVRQMAKPERRQYALALASLASGRQSLLAAAFGNSAVRQRIIAVAKYRRLTLAAALLTVLFLLALAVVLLTNPAAG